MKRAIITGILGQDGSFLYELLERLGYQVYGIARKNLSTNSKKIKDELSKRGKNPIIYEVDLQEYEEIKNVRMRRVAFSFNGLSGGNGKLG